MVARRSHQKGFIFLLVLGLLIASCGGSNTAPSAVPPTPAAASELNADQPDKWSLWSSGAQLRGVNIYQRRVIPDLDGTEFIGPGPFGPPYTQEDFNALAALGANFIDISAPGLFTVQPPYQLDSDAVANLDALLAMSARADLFAVISFRTGPGRSEFAIIGSAEWPPPQYVINSVWEDADARRAWSDMWQFTAQHYRDNPIVVGYDLMCEPNSNAALDIWDPEVFHAEYGGTGYDWNSWYPSLVTAIREVDPETPILVGGNSYSDITWLPYLQTIDDPHVVYTIHQYSPHEYTHQEPPDLTRTYPGSFDADYDGSPETVDRAWLENLLAIAVDFQAQNHAVIAVNEFGLERWEPGGADFVRDELELFDRYGWNSAAWLWYASWPPLQEGDNSFNFLLGPDPQSRARVPNLLLDTFREAWSSNTIRPSNFH